MPASAGSVRMPHNNRMDSSSALKMTGIWKNTIKYDPYAPEGGDGAADDDEDSGFEQFQGLLKLAKMQNGEAEGRGQWKGRGKLKGGWVSMAACGSQVPSKATAAPVADIKDTAQFIVQLRFVVKIDFCPRDWMALWGFEATFAHDAAPVKGK